MKEFHPYQGVSDYRMKVYKITCQAHLICQAHSLSIRISVVALQFSEH